MNRLAAALLLILSLCWLPRTVLAVTPLVVDDADVVPEGEFEVTAFYETSRFDGLRTHSVVHGITYGIAPSLELGFEFGWVREREDGVTLNDIDDIPVGLKWLFHESESLYASLFTEVKLPVASASRGIGSGEPDYTLGLILTFAPAETLEIDLNLLYTTVDRLKPAASKDELFFGIALRRPLTDAFTLVGETFAELPPDRLGDAEVFLRGGFQWEFKEAVFLDLALGCGVGETSGHREAGLGLRLEF